MRPSELVLMASLELSPTEAAAELVRLEPALINLQYLHLVAMGIVTASVLNVRERPNATAQVIGRLRQDNVVEIWGKSADGNWLAVGGTQPGWVAREWVALPD